MSNYNCFKLIESEKISILKEKLKKSLSKEKSSHMTPKLKVL